MRYVIWHTPRTGSNYLCNMLHNASGAGIADYQNYGFFIGWEVASVDDFSEKTHQFFEKQETENGLAGCKAGLQYFDHLAQRSQNVSAFQLYRAFFDTLDFMFDLSRHDKVAQAVSLYIASHTNNFTSLSPHVPETQPEYNFNRILWHYAYILSAEVQLSILLRTVPRKQRTVIMYEDMIKQPQKVLDTFSEKLKTAPLQYSGVILEKQATKLNDVFIQQFKKDLYRR